MTARCTSVFRPPVAVGRTARRALRVPCAWIALRVTARYVGPAKHVARRGQKNEAQLSRLLVSVELLQKWSKLFDAIILDQFQLWKSMVFDGPVMFIGFNCYRLHDILKHTTFSVSYVIHCHQ